MQASGDKINKIGSVCVGIDIGTTTVCAVVYDTEKRVMLASHSAPHNSYLCKGERTEQDVHLILEKAKELFIKGTPIEQVIEHCGYFNVSSFRRSFKKHTKMTISAFLAQNTAKKQ